MSAIHDLIAQVSDPRLRERLASEWANASKNKKFGLVFEAHLPELLPLHGVRPRRGDLVCRKPGPLKDVWRVRAIRDGVATCVRALEDANPAEESQPTIRPVQIAFDDLLVVRQFGEPIFPALSQVDCVANGPADAPWHTLIEADNYHALQLLDYLYAGKVDCIYIDPPYNTGSRDWKYNNHYIDKNDAWRHSKWLAFMEKRLLLAKRLLKTDSSTLIITIDEHEIYHLGMLLESLFPDAVQQLVTIVTNQKGVEQGRFARVEEYACFCFFGKSTVPVGDDDLLSSGLEGASSRLAASSGPPRWERLQRGGNNANPVARYGLFYPVYVDPTTKRITSVGRSLAKGARPTANELGNERIAWPIRRDGSYATWQVGPDTLERLINDGLVRLGGYDKKKKNVDHPLLRVESSRANT